jgi:hypothetical protein
VPAALPSRRRKTPPNASAPTQPINAPTISAAMSFSDTVRGETKICRASIVNASAVQSSSARQAVANCRVDVRPAWPPPAG